MNTTLTRRAIDAPENMLNTHVASRINRAHSILMAARCLMAEIKDYDNRDYLSEATQAMSAVEKTLTAAIRKADAKDYAIEDDLYGAASICSLVSQVVWGECAVTSVVATNVSVVLDEAVDILNDAAGTAGSLARTNVQQAATKH